MNVSKTTALAAALALFGAGACADLNVPNLNEPGRDQVGEGGADPSALIGGAYSNYLFAISHLDGVTGYMSTAAFQHSSMAANFGQVERSALPRQPLNNHPASAYASNDEFTWNYLYRSLAAVNDGMQVIDGGAEAHAAAPAFGHFMRGVVYGALAIGYDQAMILPDDFQYDTEKLPLEQGLSFSPASDVFAKSVDSFDKAIAALQGQTFTVPAGWLGASSYSAAELMRAAHSYRAYYRTMMPRTPGEAAANNWDAVIADLDAANDAAVVVDMDGSRFWRYDGFFMQWWGPWTKLPYQIYGMSDTTGAFQAWMALPPAERLEIVIAGPDLRFPRGNTLAAQQEAANRGRYFWNSPGGQANADRGTWRWSHYVDLRNNAGVRFPALWADEGEFEEISHRMQRLMRAEALFHKGMFGEAADIVNESRVGTGGLPAAAPGNFQTAPNCVPRLPDGTCGEGVANVPATGQGQLWEALKWEWRMETLTQGFSTWFMNSRRWGDLPVGTFLNLPVPANELMTFGESIYTFGGIGGPGAAPVGTYGY